MKATEFEFEKRFWIIGAIFFLGFWIPPFTGLDRLNAVEAIVRWLRPGVDLDTATYRRSVQLFFVAGAALVFLAAWMRTWATAYLDAGVVHDAHIHSDQLIASGPFRYVRNPLYLATLSMAVGTAFLATRVGALFIVLGMIVFLYRLIWREEAGLFATQGVIYQRYFNAVPRMLPNPFAKIPQGTVRPDWKKAIAAEMWFWLFGVATLVFALTLRMILYAAAMILAFGSYTLFVVALHRGKK